MTLTLPQSLTPSTKKSKSFWCSLCGGPSLVEQLASTADGGSPLIVAGAPHARTSIFRTNILRRSSADLPCISAILWCSSARFTQWRVLPLHARMRQQQSQRILSGAMHVPVLNFFFVLLISDRHQDCSWQLQDLHRVALTLPLKVNRVVPEDSPSVP